MLGAMVELVGAGTIAQSFEILDIPTSTITQSSTRVYRFTTPTANPSGVNYGVVGSVCPACGKSTFVFVFVHGKL